MKQIIWGRRRWNLVRFVRDINALSRERGKCYQLGNRAPASACSLFVGPRVCSCVAHRKLGLEVCMAVTMERTVRWNVTPWSGILLPEFLGNVLPSSWGSKSKNISLLLASPTLRPWGWRQYVPLYRGKLLPEYTSSLLRRQYSSESPLVVDLACNTRQLSLCVRNPRPVSQVVH
jgi:hypothetical protein